MTIPDEMKAIDIKEPGGPEMLVPVTVPIPELTSDQVLIKNEAVGVNRPDVAQRTGNYPVPPDANPLPGLEVAGEVVAMGSEAGNWEVGEKVTALTHGGGYAEYTAVHHGHCLPWPAGFDAFYLPLFLRLILQFTIMFLRAPVCRQEKLYWFMVAVVVLAMRLFKWHMPLVLK